MELLSISLDKFYKFAHQVLGQPIPENVLGKITVSVSCRHCSLFAGTFTLGFSLAAYLKVECKSCCCTFSRPLIRVFLI